MIKNKILLITGGTGSLGNAVLNRFLHTDHFKEIRIFSRDEKKQDDMRHELNNPNVKFYIGDVRDRRAVNDVMNGVDYVFHAAALKQVPSCEFFPMEAVKTNILGTENVLDSAIAHGIKSVVVLSTDKAAYPTSAMGISKAMMEKVATSKGRTLGDNAKTTICCTRFGNVMASRGSVIPLFINQIKSGKDLSVTNLKMTRFMMTVEEAVDLVLFAWEKGENGDLFIQKSSAVTIGTLAQAIIDLYKSSSKIKVIGSRHGEKFFETLVTREEMAKSIDMGNYLRVPCDSRDLNYDKYFTEGEQNTSLSEGYQSHNANLLDIAEAKQLLLKVQTIREDLEQ